MFDTINQFYVSGAVAAFAHELVYWTNVVRRDQKIKAKLVLLSLLYVIVGGILAGLVCEEPEFQYNPYALGIGYLWNDFLKGLSGVVITIAKSRELLDQKLLRLGSGRGISGDG